MDDYIKRTDAVKISEKYGLANGSVLGRHTGLADCIASEISGLPAADVVPVRHGRWIDAYPDIESNPMFMYGICSECGFEQGISKYLNYCPNCGAKMDGGDGNIAMA